MTPSTQEMDGEQHDRRFGRRLGLLFRVLRRTVGGLLVLASLAIIPIGISAGRYDERLARAVPVQQAVVVSVEEVKWSKYDDVTIKIARPGDGVAVELIGGNDLDPRPAVGDRIGVIVDPEDSEYILAADVDWEMHWYWYLLGVVIGLLCAGCSAQLLV
ncbi:hypothetical protein [Kribbella sp. NPDC023855]|uniref:hypothetical protein n=1 Tax=Kribbella sp. NPDC023855 TaxID=3154698 RepID=UPI0033DF4E86